jgi:multidrug efflux pump subunit AcrA (membrane-fusion protein)
LRTGDLGIKPGVSAKAEIEIDELKQVLLVPVNAVFTHEGRTYAYVKDGGIAPRELKLGSNNDTHAVVLDGVREGETVLLYEPEHIALPTPVQAAPAAPVAAIVPEKE